MIESCYWKEDLLVHEKKLKPVKNPRRWTEKSQVNFEKEICISFFLIRKLLDEKTKLSSKSTNYSAHIYRCPCTASNVTYQNYWKIDEIYDLDNEEKVYKKIRFISNQFIHGGAIYAYRNEDRNWGGLYTCSDFERAKYIYRIPTEEIRKIFQIVGNDYPHSMRMEFCPKKNDYVITTN